VSAQALKTFLEDPGRPAGTLKYHELQGFLFAVASASELVLPSEWMPFVDRPALSPDCTFHDNPLANLDEDEPVARVAAGSSKAVGAENVGKARHDGLAILAELETASSDYSTRQNNTSHCLCDWPERARLPRNGSSRTATCSMRARSNIRQSGRGPLLCPRTWKARSRVRPPETP
jgi:hypothetical protein